MAPKSESEPGSARLDQLWRRGRELLGVRYAILGGAMSWLSERHLVAAISNAGGFGVIACGAMTPDLLEAEIKATAERTDKPFGVNLITMHPEIEDLMTVCVACGVGHVVLAGGLPRTADIERLKQAGIRVLGFAPALAVARRLVRAGIDGIKDYQQQADFVSRVRLVNTHLCKRLLPCPSRKIEFSHPIPPTNNPP